MKCRRTFLISSLFATLLLSCTPVLAEDSEFSFVVRQVESYFHAKRTPIPFLGLMKPVPWIAPPAGAKRTEMALLEDQAYSRGLDHTEFEKLMDKSIRRNRQPLARVHSRRDSDASSI